MKTLTKGPSMTVIISLILLAAVLFLVSVGCSNGAETTATPTPAATETATPAPTQTPRPTPKPLFLTVTTPEDESIVATSEVEVAGTTLPTAIVSVNGTMVDVEDDGGFSTTVTLEEGPNTIEVVASTIKGEEKGEVRMVMYIP